MDNVFDDVYEICCYYSAQYGMNFDICYDPLYFDLIILIGFGETIEKHSVMVSKMTREEITSYIHLLVLDVLAKNEKGVIL